MVSERQSINWFIFNVAHKCFRAGLGCGQVVDLLAPLLVQSAFELIMMLRDRARYVWGLAAMWPAHKKAHKTHALG